MIKFPEDCVLYGFAFGEDIFSINMKEVRINLEERVDLKKVIFSLFYEDKMGYTYIIAANRYLNDKEIEDILLYLIENNIEEEFCLTDFIGT